jgi:hypothetical protein
MVFATRKITGKTVNATNSICCWNNFKKSQSIF